MFVPTCLKLYLDDYYTLDFNIQPFLIAFFRQNPKTGKVTVTKTVA